MQVLQNAIGPVGLSEVTLHLAGTLTTANSDIFDEYADVGWATPSLTDQGIVVPCVTLDAFLEDVHAPEGFDVLSVDVEGLD